MKTRVVNFAGKVVDGAFEVAVEGTSPLWGALLSSIVLVGCPNTLLAATIAALASLALLVGTLFHGSIYMVFLCGFIYFYWVKTNRGNGGILDHLDLYDPAYSWDFYALQVISMSLFLGVLVGTVFPK